MRKMSHIIRAALLVALLLLPAMASVDAGHGEKGTCLRGVSRESDRGHRDTHGRHGDRNGGPHAAGPAQHRDYGRAGHNVLNTEEGRYYYELATMGPVTISEDDFDIHSGLHWATLDTVIPVYDNEAGITTDPGLNVTWTATDKVGPHERTATATLGVSSASLSPQYITNPLTDPLEAFLRRVR